MVLTTSRTCSHLPPAEVASTWALWTTPTEETPFLSIHIPVNSIAEGGESSQICDKLRNISGATVDVFVDMATCKLSFSINGAPHVDVPVDLPAAVCPFGSLTNAGDAVALSYRPHVMLVLDVGKTTCEVTGSILLRFTTKGGNEVALLVAEQEPDSAELMWDSVVDQIDLPQCDIKLLLHNGTSYCTEWGAENSKYARGCRRQYTI